MHSEQDITVIDDSGLLGLVDHRAYASFVGTEWTFEQLLAHFNSEMVRRRILVWNCEDGGDEYLIRVRHGVTSERGYREVVGGISVSSDTVLISSYDALTMAAQFADEPLPAKHQAHQLIEISPGAYTVRIVQTYDPRGGAAQTDGQPHFLIELEPGYREPWTSVAWLSV